MDVALHISCGMMGQGLQRLNSGNTIKKRSQRQNIEAAGPVAYPLSPCGRRGMAAMAEGGTA